MNDIVWTPGNIERSTMWTFAKATQPLHGADPSDYGALHAWSISSPEAFYSALWDQLEIIGDRSEVAYVPATDQRDVRFYPGARVNYAENLLSRRDDGLAIIAHRDDGTRRTMTRRALYDAVSRMVQVLEANGIGQGDRVAAIVTHDIEAIVSHLACSAIGAIWSSCSPDFGPGGASDRLCQIEPKLLVAVSSYSYAGKKIDVIPTIRAVAEGARLNRILVIGPLPDAMADLPAVAWNEALEQYAPRPIAFRRMAFEAPLAILFSSGTTGKPKCITHSGGGLLLQHKKELALHCDLRPNERFFYFTTCGWMMWNWQVSGLAVGATLITYDGNPFHPAPARLIDLIDAEGIDVFGTSAKYIDSCLKSGLIPRDTHRLDKLKLILSTGSPLIPASFDYVYSHWKSDVHLASISGGTDICGCFLGGNPILPVRRGELQCALLGMDMDTLNETGAPATGRPGELVCRSAHLSMPVKFWGDEDGSKYQNAYFSSFPGLWAQGDYAEKRASGGYVIHGRSDTTLNPGGVRIGTAEIYRQVETIAQVAESLAVGQDIEGDQRIVLFVRLRPGADLDEALEKAIRTTIRKGASPRHVPARILAVSDIPRTRSGKISESAVRDVIHGRLVQNTTALANPECLDAYRDLAALRN